MQHIAADCDSVATHVPVAPTADEQQHGPSAGLIRRAACVQAPPRPNGTATVLVATAEQLADAVNGGGFPRIVVTEHLDLRSLPPLLKAGSALSDGVLAVAGGVESITVRLACCAAPSCADAGDVALQSKRVCARDMKTVPLLQGDCDGKPFPPGVNLTLGPPQQPPFFNGVQPCLLQVRKPGVF